MMLMRLGRKRSGLQIVIRDQCKRAISQAVVSRHVAHRPCWRMTLLTCCVLGGCSYGPAFENSHRAVNLMQILNIAEAKYWRQHGRYGDLSALGPTGANLIPSQLASGKTSGYQFRVTASEYKYTATAWPLIERETGFRSLYSDETGVVRGNWTGQATATSPPITQMK